jgi:hypothetical protein
MVFTVSHIDQKSVLELCPGVADRHRKTAALWALHALTTRLAGLSAEFTSFPARFSRQLLFASVSLSGLLNAGMISLVALQRSHRHEAHTNPAHTDDPNVTTASSRGPRRIWLLSSLYGLIWAMLANSSIFWYALRIQHGQVRGGITGHVDIE